MTFNQRDAAEALAIEVQPQIIVREVQSRDQDGALWCHDVEDRTGWWEAKTKDGLCALGQTATGAVEMIERMRAAQSAR